jgi:cardiolipin synthase A/B
MIPDITLVSVATLIGAAFIIWLILVVFFTPGINYHVESRQDACSSEFSHKLVATSQAVFYRGNRIEVLTNGATFYPAMLQAIKASTQSVNLECYIFHPGEIADQFIDALIERARAGVKVTIVADAIGSARLAGARVRRLRAAGCRLEFYQPLRWYRLARINNRTHRELLVVDGRVGFVGGAGIADWWAIAHGTTRSWRDTMARLEGPVVTALQGVFVENWLECCGEILIGNEYFPPLSTAGDTTALVVKSSPSDRATVSRVVFQLLIDAACNEVLIATPYFLPDRALRRVLVDTVRRGVPLSVIVPGSNTDQRWVRLASRRNYGRLLEAGVRIFEYEQAMIHTKVLIVDQTWGVLGTTNIDNRSFEHNDEVNIVMRDDAIARRLIADYQRDVADSREITLDAWKGRPLWEKVIGTVAWILERQQ